MRRLTAGLLAAALLLLAGLAAAQLRWRRRSFADRGSIPDQAVDRDQPEDIFTFARLRYSSWRRSNDYETDWPDADLNLAYRLRQLTSLKVHSKGVIIDITDENLRNYPFVYMVEPGGLELTEEEVAALRRYFEGGGFLMVDDFWGEREWQNYYLQMKRVFPNREPQDLDISHPIFHAVIPLAAKPQMPSINVWQATGLTYERPDAHEPHYRAFFDDNGRMMVIACHNTDLGDGWEREGEDPRYFQMFSEKMAYPMAINIIFYAMTH
jgi:hypothetical protein